MGEGSRSRVSSFRVLREGPRNWRRVGLPLKGGDRGGEDADNLVEKAHTFVDDVGAKPMAHSEVATAVSRAEPREKSRKRMYSCRLRRP